MLFVSRPRAPRKSKLYKWNERVCVFKSTKFESESEWERVIDIFSYFTWNYIKNISNMHK